MSLTTLMFAQAKQNLVNQFLRAYFNLAPTDPIPDVDVGSLLAAIFNADTENYMVGQANVAYAYGASRMQTSTGEDVFSFGQQFSVDPLGADSAITTERCFTSSAAISPIPVPVGFTVQRTDGTQYKVVVGTEQTYVPGTTSGWDVAAQTWYIAETQTYVDVTIECTSPGSIGDCIAGAISIISGSGTPVPQISSVTNPEPVNSGEDQETTDAYKSRFTTQFAAGGPNATADDLAIISAALKVQTGLIYSYGNNINPNTLAEELGWFTLVINESNTGTAPPDSLLTAVTTAVEAVRGAGTYYKVIAPTIEQVPASAVFTFKQGIDPTQGLAAAAAQYAMFVNATGLQPDTSPSLVELSAVYATLLRDTQLNGIPCVQNVKNLLLNGVAGDATAPFATQLVAGATTFTSS